MNWFVSLLFGEKMNPVLLKLTLNVVQVSSKLWLFISFSIEVDYKGKNVVNLFAWP